MIMAKKEKLHLLPSAPAKLKMLEIPYFLDFVLNLDKISKVCFKSCWKFLFVPVKGKFLRHQHC